MNMLGAPKYTVNSPRGDHVQNDQIENMKIKTTKF
jgi:hypothetical protein